MVEKNSEELEKLKKKINGIDVKYAETEEVIAKMSVEEAIYFTRSDDADSSMIVDVDLLSMEKKI